MMQAWMPSPEAAIPAAVKAFQFHCSGFGEKGSATVFDTSPSVSICHWEPIVVAPEGTLQKSAVAKEPLTTSKRSGVELGRHVHVAVNNSGTGSPPLC